MPANYVLLERIELNASAASVTFSSIPQSGYTDLKIVASTRDTRSNTANGLVLRFNGSSTGFTSRVIEGNGGSAYSFTDTQGLTGENTSATATANTFSSTECYIPNYTSSNNKSFSFDSVSENNATTAYADLGAGLWSNTAAITSITLTSLNSASFVANSTFSLYGLAALGTTPVIAPKASGGNITTDGTYWIHTFLTTGAFVPQTNLTCDALVVAGGGSGGGGSGGAGGGGAGGFRTATGLAVTATSYTVTIGAGAAGVPQNVNGIKGSDSVFSTITSTGGGYGAVENQAGGSGGSGGGSAYTGNGAGSGNTPSTSPSQGNNGGNATVGSPYPGSGGGGAGAVGNGGSGSTGGAGGAGTANSYSGSSVTYAGGGGGGSRTTGGAGGTGGGGTGQGGSTAAVAGTANTGGGGGGASDNLGLVSASGGSGIVIIRYPIA